LPLNNTPKPLVTQNQKNLQ